MTTFNYHMSSAVTNNYFYLINLPPLIELLSSLIFPSLLVDSFHYCPRWLHMSGQGRVITGFRVWSLIDHRVVCIYASLLFQQPLASDVHFAWWTLNMIIFPRRHCRQWHLSDKKCSAACLLFLAARYHTGTIWELWFELENLIGIPI